MLGGRCERHGGAAGAGSGPAGGCVPRACRCSTAAGRQPHPPRRCSAWIGMLRFCARRLPAILQSCYNGCLALWPLPAGRAHRPPCLAAPLPRTAGLLLERATKLHADRQQGGDATTPNGVLCECPRGDGWQQGIRAKGQKKLCFPAADALALAPNRAIKQSFPLRF